MTDLDRRAAVRNSSFAPKESDRRRTARIVRGATSELAIYDGRDCCGFIRPSGDAFLLLDAERRTIGVFPSLREALAAIGGTP